MRHLLVAAMLTGCGPGQGHGGPPNLTGLTSIDVLPATSTLTIRDGVAATADFIATGHFKDGHSADLTSQVSWSLADVQLGTLAGAHYTSVTTRGGATQVHAMANQVGVSGDATLNLDLVLARVSTADGSTAPATSSTLFGATATDPQLAPGLAYPLDGTLVPPNLGEMEIQWRKPAGPADLFEVSVLGPHFELRVYSNALTAAGGRLALVPAEWSSLASTLAGATASIQVRGVVAASPTAVGSSTTARMVVGKDDVKGGIYYWSAKGGLEGIKRHEFGNTTSAAKAFYTKTDAVWGGTNHCVACHVVSRDGKKFAITYDGGNGVSGLLDVATKNALIPYTRGLAWNFAAMSPDGNRMVGSHLGVLTLYDVSGGASTGNTLGTIDTGGFGTQPDWSPDGTKLAFVRVGAPPAGGDDWHFAQGSIVVLTAGAGGTFGNPKIIVPWTSDNNYYPSFSPDSNWILFNRSTSDAYNNPDATIWVISADGSVGPIRLVTANATGAITNSWPRWSPFLQPNGPNGSLFYFTFSSMRDYGIEIVGAARPQIWMAAFDPKTASVTMDPSWAPFWLPFQDSTTNNHIAQWTTAIIGIQ